MPAGMGVGDVSLYIQLVKRGMPEQLTEEQQANWLSNKFQEIDNLRSSLRLERDGVKAVEADREDWRNGVDLIATALGVTGPGRLACAALAEQALEFRAELRRLNRIRLRADDAIDAWQRDALDCPVLLRDRLKKLQAEIGAEAPQ